MNSSDISNDEQPLLYQTLTIPTSQLTDDELRARVMELKRMAAQPHVLIQSLKSTKITKKAVKHDTNAATKSKVANILANLDLD